MAVGHAQQSASLGSTLGTLVDNFFGGAPTADRKLVMAPPPVILALIREFRRRAESRETLQTHISLSAIDLSSQADLRSMSRPAISESETGSMSGSESELVHGTFEALPDMPTVEEASISFHVLTLDFDAHEWARRYPNDALPYMAFLMHQHFELDGVVSVRRFTAAVYMYNQMYRDSSSSPYHNAVHATDVLQVVSVLLDTLRRTERGRAICPPHTVAVMLLAAAAHDIEHCGVSSDLLVNIRHPLYHLFGSESTLELYHSFLGVYVVRYYGVFEKIDSGSMDHDGCSDMFQRLILATDPKSIFGSASELTRVAQMINKDPSSIAQPDVVETLMCAIIRMADISNAS
ncbi:hypothetical protein KIPB_009432, partial [Kipferlia bialata]|eukprot:g9432.t1